MPMLKETMLKRLLLPMVAAGGGGSAPVQDTATGNPLTFLTDLASPLKSLLIPFTPKQEGTGDPSPTNVRNIVPFTECNILRIGVNLWDEEWEIGSINNDTGQNVPSDNTLRSKNYSPCIPGERYFVYHRLNGSDMRLHWYRKDKTFISSSWRNIGSFTAPDDAYYFRFRMASSYGTEYKNDIGINYPYTETTYKAYTGNNVYSVMFHSPVYGGVLDAVAGVLTVEYALVDASDLKWVNTNQSANGVFRANLPTARNLDDKFNVYSDKYKNGDASSSVGGMPDNTIKGYNGEQYQDYVYIRDGRYTDVDDFSQELDCEICYQLATPQEIQLTKAQITAIVGDNTIWSDADGSMTAIYLKKG